MIDALANWTWLVALPKLESAVIVSTQPDAIVHALASGFANTRVVNPDDSRDLEDLRMRLLANGVGGAPDCIISSSGGSPERVRDLVPRLRAIRSVLSVGAGHYVAIERIRRPGIRGRVAAFLPSSQRRALKRAGYNDVRVYYIVPSPQDPRHLVPSDQRALVAWDHSMDATTIRSIIRRALMISGIHAPFFLCRLIVARA